jgi:uncharacterized membrane protein YidH (DUF202 family)
VAAASHPVIAPKNIAFGRPVRDFCSMSKPAATPQDLLAIQELQLLLAEKRTALSTLRTGLAIFAFPLSVLSVLIATSRSYQLHQVLHWLLPLLAINLGLVALAVYLVGHGLRRLKHYDWRIAEFKRQHSRVAEFLG